MRATDEGEGLCTAKRAGDKRKGCRRRPTLGGGGRRLHCRAEERGEESEALVDEPRKTMGRLGVGDPAINI